MFAKEFTYVKYLNKKYDGVFICLLSHHGDILSRVFEFIFDAASDVSEIRKRELFKLNRSQNAGMGLEHLQSLNNTQAHTR